ncbi:Kdo domain containing protein [Aquimarina sp. TRL1]|uniref:lipopolysaccharide kinase InaA family protein n=1 Tax=Aquimarina sp. (strain TRL1) TaxID=2736252 RepID=UPI00158CBB0A|nr:lipopolysaccharide kinase InaA family protein [Aquimarina sp. TRL1]QKX03438.1 Kdo domain containing protein [Aquimarina sp. TRL1]
MKNNIVVDDLNDSLRADIEASIANFDNYKEILGAAERNVIKIASIGGKRYTIKSFKIPNFINQVVYRFFRKSKAERSYRYARKLLGLGINTPFPLAYSTSTTLFLFKNSYYVSELVTPDLTYRELVHQPDFPDHETILRAFTRFTFELHEQGVLFLDHSPGNTLILNKGGKYEFYLVDLNRMKFKTLSLDERIHNFARLTPKKEMVQVMSNEYSKLTGKDEQYIFEKMWSLTEAFQHKYHKKIALKRKVFFWKKKYREK